MRTEENPLQTNFPLKPTWVSGGPGKPFSILIVLQWYSSKSYWHEKVLTIIVTFHDILFLFLRTAVSTIEFTIYNLTMSTY